VSAVTSYVEDDELPALPAPTRVIAPPRRRETIATRVLRFIPPPLERTPETSSEEPSRRALPAVRIRCFYDSSGGNSSGR